MFRPRPQFPGQKHARDAKGYIHDLSEVIEDAAFHKLGIGYSPACDMAAHAVLKLIEDRPPPSCRQINTASAISIGLAMFEAWNRGGETEVIRLMENPKLKACLPEAIDALPDAFDTIEQLPGY